MIHLIDPRLWVFLFQAILLSSYIPLSYLAYQWVRAPLKQDRVRQELSQLGLTQTQELLQTMAAEYRLRHYIWPLSLVSIETFLFYSITHPYVIELGLWKGVLEEVVDVFGLKETLPWDIVAGRILFWGWLGAFVYYRKTTTSGSGPKKGSTRVGKMTSIMYQPRRCETNRRYMMTRQFKKLAHSLYECKYHVVFCPKYRYKIMQDEVAKYITQQIYRLSSQKDGVEVIEVNVQPEHVHLVVSIPPKYAVSQYMGFLKGKLALHLFDRYPQLRQRYWGQHVWSRGYCVSTVGLDEERIKKYVKWQRRKDADTDATQGRLFD